MRNVWTGIAATIVLWLGGVVPAHGDGEEIQLARIIENLRTNEALYENSEVRLRVQVRQGDAWGLGPDWIERGDRSLRHVRQGPWLYLERHGQDVTDTGQIQKADMIEGYDGQTRRMVDQGSVVNIRDTPPAEPSVFRPHLLFLTDSAGIDYPLSNFLQGDRFIRARPRHQNLSVKIAYVGDETIEGLNCHKIRIEYLVDSWKERTKPHIRFLWLAPDRNYLTMRTAFFQSPWIEETDRPMEVGWIEDLREIAPGVWFPHRATLQVYNLAHYKNGRYVPLVTTQKFVDQAALDPEYDISLFRDIAIPNGADVYVFQGDEVVRKYTQGGAHTQPPRPKSFPWLTVVLTAAFAGFLAFARFRKRARAA